MSKSVNLLFRPVTVKLFHALQNLRVQHAPALREERVVRHLTGQRMLERVLDFRIQARFIEKLDGFEMADAVLQHIFRHIDNLSQQCERHRLADDGCGLQDVLFLGWQPIDAGGEDRLHTDRHFDTRQRPRKAIVAGRTGERIGFQQCPHTLFEEEGISLSLLDEQPLERSQAGVRADQTIQQRFRRFRRQGIDAQLTVAGPASPRVLVLGPVIGEQHYAGARDTVDEVVEECLRFGVYPVQILEDQEQRLYLALREEKPLARIEGSLPTLRRIQPLPLRIVRRSIEQIEECRDARHE